MSCLFSGVATHWCVSKGCSRNSKYICSSRVCECSVQHSKCQVLRADEVADQVLRRANPEYEAVDYLYTQAIERLRVERVRRLARVGESQLSMLGEEERELLESLGKAEDLRELRQLLSDLPAGLLSKVGGNKIDSGKGEKVLIKAALDKSISENITQLVASINSSSSETIKPNDRPELIAKEYLRESINSSLIIQSADYQGKTIDKLPPGVDFSKITSLSVSYYDDKLTPFFLKHVTNLKKLQITHLDKASGMYLGYTVPTSFNSPSPDSQNLQTINALAKLPSLKQLIISQFKDLRDQQYVKYLLLFPSNKSLKLHDKFANKFTIMEILMQKQDWQSIYLSFVNTAVGTNSPLTIDSHLIDFLFLTNPHLKKLTIPNATLTTNTILTLSKFTSLTKLELQEKINHLVSNSSQQEDTNNMKLAVKTLVNNLPNLETLGLSSPKISAQHIQAIKQSCTKIKHLQFRTYPGQEGVPIFVQLGQLKSLEVLSMNVDEITGEGWHVLAKAEFRLKKLFLTQRFVPVTISNKVKMYDEEVSTVAPSVIADSPHITQILYSMYGGLAVSWMTIDCIPPAALPFFLSQPAIQQFQTKSQGNNALCIMLSHLKYLSSLHFSTQKNDLSSKPLTNAGYFYLSKLRSLKEFNTEINEKLIGSRNKSQGVLRLVRNNQELKLKLNIENAITYRYSTHKMLRNLSLRDGIRYFAAKNTSIEYPLDRVQDE